LNTKVIGFKCGPWGWYKGVGEIPMNKGRVGEERKGKETDGCQILATNQSEHMFITTSSTIWQGYFQERL
jgi:hypothetical protein